MVYCAECSLGFFYSPVKVGVVLLSILVSLSLLYILKKYTIVDLKKRLALIYGHVFTLVFPFVFFVLFQGCQVLISSCDGFEKVISLLLITMFISLIIGLLVTPYLYVSIARKHCVRVTDEHISRFVQENAESLQVSEPRVCFLNLGKPIAFSFKYFRSAIFLSIGLLDLLNQKEREAVVLHEMYHLKERSSLYTYSLRILRFVSPLAFFTGFEKEFILEEQRADAFASQMQGTSEYVASAKEKMDKYYEDSVRELMRERKKRKLLLKD
ncbi:MAG: M48 family metalloprotease [bacterium]|nr:M48 family metalloprotease [bacterium]